MSALPDEPSRGIERRTLLTYLVGAPVLTLAARLVADTAIAPPAAAYRSRTSVEDVFDIGDALVGSAAPTMPLIVLEVGSDGIARMDLPKTELGQGITTAVSMLIAEELDLPLDRVRLAIADARPELLFAQITAGSATVRTFYEPVRYMAATARLRLVAAAAHAWGVPQESLRTENGAVVGADRRADYGALSAAAAAVDLRGMVARPKSPEAFTVIGRPTRRLDARDIVTGRKKFTMDVLAGKARPALVRRPPTMLGTVTEVLNAEAVAAMPGVRAVVPIPTGVAVVADTVEQCRRGVNALKVTWGPGPIAEEDNDSIRAALVEQLPELPPAPAGRSVEATFDWAPLCHAPMETECAVADVRADRAEFWGGFQGPVVVKQELALLLGLPEQAVTVHVTSPGGGFGRRGFFEGVIEAAHVSKAIGEPVRLMWHRADDMRHGRTRPAVVHRVRAVLTDRQDVLLDHRASGVALDVAPGLGEILTHTATNLPPDAKTTAGKKFYSQTLFTLMVSSPYDFAYDRTLTELPNGMPTAAYRSVHCPTTRTSEEIVVNELAIATGQDPLQFRVDHAKDAAGAAALAKVAELGNWGRRLGPGRAQGVGYHKESKTFTACIAEIDVRSRRPRVTRMTMVADVGVPVNPSGIEAQMHGCIAEAISTTLTAGLHVVDGLPLEGSYSHYHWLRMRDFPENVTVHLQPPSGEIGGVGEVGIASASAAIANAWARATGRKARSFPLHFDVDFRPFPPGVLPSPPLRAFS